MPARYAEPGSLTMRVGCVSASACRPRRQRAYSSSTPHPEESARGGADVVLDGSGSYDPDFPVRGLVIDTKLGTIFKMDRHQHVQRAMHGTKKLSREMRRSTYRNTEIRPYLARYELMDTLFELPEMFLYAALVDWIDATLPSNKRRRAYQTAYTDLREVIDCVHRDGSLKTVIRMDPGTYLERDPDLLPTLRDFRAVGKKLFLMTNSEWEYTHAVMSFLSGSTDLDDFGWMELFDVVISFAKKPSFFRESDF